MKKSTDCIASEYIEIANILYAYRYGYITVNEAVESIASMMESGRTDAAAGTRDEVRDRKLRVTKLAQ